MKRYFYFMIAVFCFMSVKVNAQYHFGGGTWPAYYDSGSVCRSPILNLTTNAYSSTLIVKTYWGDGTSQTDPVLNGGSYGYLTINSRYSSPGTYTVKNVLYDGASAVDSIIASHEYLYCNSVIIKTVYDSLSSGVYDSSDGSFQVPLKLEVSKNGHIIDTGMIFSGIYYPVEGLVGDVFSFKYISVNPGIAITFPIGGIVYDTVKPTSNNYVVKYLGLVCRSATTFDLAVNPVIPVTGIYDQLGTVYVTSSSCEAADATVALTFSPKYHSYGGAYPTPSSISDNTITWNLSGITNINPARLYYEVWDVAGDLAVGDTVQEHVTMTPPSGDADPTNNVAVVIDTVRAGCDPNAMWVSPTGYIAEGTQLKYTINFENTGNDTAFNISVYDTLSDNVDIKSLNLLMASAVMNIAVLNSGGHNIIKFDFPNINLLDSSHHGQCDGAVIFTINAKSGLPNGTTIFNHAGIFFDYNPVVMTNTVENIIGTAAAVTTLNKNTETTIYPNPANNELTINTGSNTYATAIITNTLGQVLMAQSLSSNDTKIKVSALTPGLYYLTLRGESGVEVKKFEKL